MGVKEIREALESLVKGKDCGTFEVSCEADNEDELQAKVDATDDLWRFAHKALALLDAPVASDATQAAKDWLDRKVKHPENTTLALSRFLETFAADRERKAREECEKLRNSFSRAASALRLYGTQFEEYFQLAHKRPVPSSIAAMLCNMTERHSCEMSALCTQDGFTRQLMTELALLEDRHPELVRKAREEMARKCADAAIAWYRSGQLIPAHTESFSIKTLRAAILQAEPAQDDGKPEIGDLVISASSQTVQWNGCPDPWYWTQGDPENMRDETIVVLMRAAEVKRRIEEATPCPKP